MGNEAKNSASVTFQLAEQEIEGLSAATPRPWGVSFVRWNRDSPVMGFAIHSDSVQKLGLPIASINCATPNVASTAVYSEAELEANAKLIVAAVNAYTQSAWQTIDTAPKDGTEILAAHDAEGLVWTDQWMAEWEIDGKKGCWRQYEAWQEGLIEGPTHWMPLPAAPSTQDTNTPAAGGTDSTQG